MILLDDFLFHVVYLVKHIKRGEFLLARNVLILQLLNDLLKIKRLIANPDDWWLGSVRHAERTFTSRFITRINKISPKPREKELNKSLIDCLNIFEDILREEIEKKYSHMAEEYLSKMEQVRGYITEIIGNFD